MPPPQRRPGPAPKQERVFGRDRPRNVGVLFVPRSRPRLAGAAYTKFLFTIIYWGGDRDTVLRGELASGL